ncbi:MAG: DUF5763 domain-containing protein [Caldilineaceae bacterium]|nr:DUF5763 domain-containing protein [Caldilineaceae bacterium]MDE0340171.1 DUF5763 domain-containing protein [Caldilineaceae bacterium]
MAKTLCKATKKDGSPCQGRGLPQYDGFCISHGPSAEETREWRARGGKNSATAARLDKRIPERLKNAIEQVVDGITGVREGTLAPAAFTAMCRGAKTLVDLYRFADEEMDSIRCEETGQAAAEFIGIPDNLELLAATVDLSARRDQYRTKFLVDQGLAELVISSEPDQPPKTVLTDEGRRRFGFWPASTLTLTEIRDWEEYLDPTPASIDELQEKCCELVHVYRGALDARGGGPAEPLPPLDPLTGQLMAELPPCVQVSLRAEYDGPFAAPRVDFLEDGLGQLNQLFQTLEEQRESETAPPDDNLSPARVAPRSDLASPAIDENGETPRPDPTGP